MPNGHDANWARFCAAVDGFHAQYGRWPTHVLVSLDILAQFRDRLFTAEDYAAIAAKVVLVPRTAGIIAKDDSGASFSYWRDRLPKKCVSPSAYEWFGVNPQPET
jgi:hypothetical protein